MSSSSPTVSPSSVSSLAGGTVRVPLGALQAVPVHVVVAAKVTTWADAGPLFYAKGLRPSGHGAWNTTCGDRPFDGRRGPQRGSWRRGRRRGHRLA